MRRIQLLITLLLLFGLTANARIKRVNSTPGVTAAYSSIENALLDCAPGDTIYLEASPNPYGPGDVYGFDPLKITKPVTIIGQGYLYKENEVVNYQIGETYIGSEIRILSKNVNLVGLILSDVKIMSNNCSVTRCQILAGTQTAIAIGDTVDGCIIRQNFIVGNIDGLNFPQNVSIINNIICGVVSQLERSRIERNTFGKYSRYGAMRNLKFCSIIENVYNQNMKNSQTNTCSFLNNYNGDFIKFMEKPDFSLDKNYRMREDSPIYEKASDGDQLGAFGGAIPYVASGLPDTPVIQSYVAPSEVNSSVGLEVTISYKIER